ncbi:MFS transporter [Microbispora sp. RL4-1S]|uniref:MFS transporter n=1 Tax=Microbispora oryzae TaxID=2806554 RepID=A0A940WH82_9ACTN|nr:MFS transporter [Microbispora oryzae]MBP2705515.1 MFS transporter [Microbispora oryzae]
MDVTDHSKGRLTADAASGPVVSGPVASGPVVPGPVVPGPVAPGPVSAASDGGAARGTSLAAAPLIALSLGYFLVMLDVTVVTVAVPQIRHSLNADASSMQWIVDGYSTIFAGLLLFGGGLGDRRGYRKVFFAGLVVFAAASAGCALAATATQLVVARLLQGAGAALLVPASLALLTAAYPDRAVRARALGIWGGIAGVAFAAGPLVGGLLVWGLDWRAVFWLNVPIVVAAILLTLRHVPAPAPRGGSRRVDVVGQVLGVVGLTAVAGALNEAAVYGWTSARVLVALAVGLVTLAVFVVLERRLEVAARTDATGRPPMLSPSWFRRSGFAATAVIGVLLNLGYYGMLFLSTLYFQQGRGYDALKTGLVLLPSVCMALVAAPLSGRLTARYGPYRPMAVALLTGTAGFLGWLVAGPDTAYPLLLFALIVTGLATPLTVPAATAAIIESAPVEAAGVATAVFNVARQVGNAVGVAMFGALAATTGLIGGLHTSALIACAAFFAGALLALFAGRQRVASPV